jgi:transglutaminase-like putative cysteine protease
MKMHVMLKHNLPLSLDRALQFHAAALAVFGAVFIGLGRESALAPALTALACLAAVAVADVLGWIRLHRWMANLLAIAAVVWSLRDFFQVASDEKLVAIANMLCYLQVVLLLQEKTGRVYWQILVLSILQLVVAAALDLGPQFALLLGLYGLVALSALVLLCIHRETHRAPKIDRAQRRQEPWAVLLARPEVAAPAAGDVERTRSFSAAFVARQTALLAAGTLLFSIVFFYVTPRMSDSAWLSSRPGGGRSGFKPEVRLEENGRIHLSSRLVMRVTLSRMSDGKPLTLVGDPYFHGEVLPEYKHDEQGGRWLPWRPNAPGLRGRLGLPRVPPQTNATLVRQDIVLEANTGNQRFAIVPIQSVGDWTLFPYGPPRWERDGFGVPRQERYAYATPAIRSQRQLHAIPGPSLPTPVIGPLPEDIERLRPLVLGEHRKALEFDADRFPRVAQVASEVLAEQNLTDARPLDKALALERHFVSPGAYHYSLLLNFRRDPELDPIEDFVANHHTGHCEYFASALAMMLRSQGIPARLVTGYKGGAFNSVGHYYAVQEQHAHSWVEAWLAADEVPDWELSGLATDGGAWYRLDPTPGRDSYVSINQPGVGQRLLQAFDYVELLWRDYVLNLNRNQQEDVVFTPLTAQASFIPSWVESRRVQSWLRRLSRELGLDAPLREQRKPRAFSPGAALLVVGALVIFTAGAFGIRLSIPVVVRLLSFRRNGVSSQAPQFYHRMERLLARIHVVRTEGQTPRELAAAAKSRLLSSDFASLASAAPADIVAAYYRVRFGGHRLDKTEMEAIEQSLAALNAAIRHKSVVRSQ